MGWNFVMGTPRGEMDVLHHEVEMHLADGQLVGRSTVTVNTEHTCELVLDAEDILIVGVGGRDVVDAPMDESHLHADFRGPVGETEVWMRWLVAPNEGEWRRKRFKLLDRLFHPGKKERNQSLFEGSSAVTASHTRSAPRSVGSHQTEARYDDPYHLGIR